MLTIHLTNDDQYKFNHLPEKDQNAILEELEKNLQILLNDYHMDPYSNFKRKNRLFVCKQDNRLWDNQKLAALYYKIPPSVLNLTLHKRRQSKRIAYEFEFIDN